MRNSGFNHNLIRFQHALLAGLSVFFLVIAPEHWNFTPDGGIYIGTAKELLENGRYWFNGTPNLLYYPGLSLFLSIPLSIFGVDFQALHLIAATLMLTALWAMRSYFDPIRFGWVGLATPIVFACSTLFLQQIFHILSDGAFLAISLGALLAWRQWERGASLGALLLCVALTAAAPLFRFQGLFLVAAMLLAYGVDGHKVGTKNIPQLLCSMSFLALTLLFPFVSWTVRNYAVHTPDTFNMANAFFFGLRGIPLYASDPHAVNWITDDWQYYFYRPAYFFLALPKTFFGNAIPKEATGVVASFIFIFLLLGVQRWWMKASTMEKIYVLISLLFLIKYAFGEGKTLYIVSRYWLPLIPFLLVMVGFGIVRLDAVSKRATKAPIFALLSAAMVTLIIFNGLSGVLHRIGQQESYAEAGENLSNAAHYVHEKIPMNAVIAVTDWGVLPLYLQRRSIQILNDEHHTQTIARMKKYSATYLAIMDGNAIFPPFARDMVLVHPEAFVELFHSGARGSKHQTSIYSVDLDLLDISAVKQKSMLQ